MSVDLANFVNVRDVRVSERAASAVVTGAFQPAHFIRTKLIGLESAPDFGEGLGEALCRCSKKCSKPLHSQKAKEEHEKP